MFTGRLRGAVLRRENRTININDYMYVSLDSRISPCHSTITTNYHGPNLHLSLSQSFEMRRTPQVQTLESLLGS